MAIGQGTTPTHTFVLPLDTSLLKTVRVVYSQCKNVIFVKTGADIILEGNKVITTLTQDDTFKLDASKVVAIQVRAFTRSNGKAINGKTKTVSVERCLEKEVMS